MQIRILAIILSAFFYVSCSQPPTVIPEKVSTTTFTTLAPTTTTIHIEAPVIAPVTSSTSTTIGRPPASTGCPQEIVDLIHQHFDPLGAGDWAVQIAWRESNCRPDVVSPTGCWSVMQLALPLHKDLYAAVGYPDWYANRFNAEANIKAAALLYKGSGKQPWTL